MQLKLRRTQRDGGLLKDTAIFCLDARAEYTPQELKDIDRYRLAGQVVYNSEASKRALEASERAAAANTIAGGFKSLGLALLAGMKLNISIGSLARGHHIECKSLEELLGAEEALMDACKNLTAFLDTAATFDGREVVIDFASGEPALVAQANVAQRVIAPERTPLAEDELPPPMPPEIAAPEEEAPMVLAIGPSNGNKRNPLVDKWLNG